MPYSNTEILAIDSADFQPILSAVEVASMATGSLTDLVTECLNDDAGTALLSAAGHYYATNGNTLTKPVTSYTAKNKAEKLSQNPMLPLFRSLQSTVSRVSKELDTCNDLTIGRVKDDAGVVCVRVKDARGREQAAKDPANVLAKLLETAAAYAEKHEMDATTVAKLIADAFPTETAFIVNVATMPNASTETVSTVN